ncbi:hypothetical protein NHQ30_011695 [Ciborinia camelliae]|nr:hypothetical protein NHQ30_011695 [Ciborinia camelliae]
MATQGSGDVSDIFESSLPVTQEPRTRRISVSASNLNYWNLSNSGCDTTLSKRKAVSEEMRELEKMAIPSQIVADIHQAACYLANKLTKESHSDEWKPLLKCDSRPNTKLNILEKAVPRFPLPTELASEILKIPLLDFEFPFRLDLCTGVCFALTCRSHWRSFRKIYTKKVSLDKLSPLDTYSQALSVTLANLLENCMHPTCRPLRCPMSKDDSSTNKPFPIVLFVSAKEYHVGGGEKERRLVSRMDEYKTDAFATIHRTVKCSEVTADKLPWHVPNPYRMGDEWYPATIHLLKHDMLLWPSDCSENTGGQWLNAGDYINDYSAWRTYQNFMLRDWVEEQPAALEYKKIHGLGEKKTTSMRHAFQMLRSVDVRTEDQKLKVKMVVEAMLKLVRGKIDVAKVMEEVKNITS